MHTISPERLARVATLKLQSGSHEENDTAMCVMEAVSFVAGEAWSDSPACACPVIAAVCRAFNDRLSTDERRTELLGPLVPQLVGSKANREVEWRRLWMLYDFSVRLQLPLLLDALKRPKEAGRLRDLGEITDRSSAMQARDVLRAIIESRDLARDLARDLEGEWVKLIKRLLATS